MIIYKRDRARYLQALRRADAGESSPLGEMLARAILNSLHRFVIPAVAGPARLRAGDARRQGGGPARGGGTGPTPGHQRT